MINLEDFIKSKRVLTGTTTLALNVKDAVVVATESQATAGYLVATKNAQKLFKITEHCAATISGGVADCQYVVGQVQAIARLREIEKGIEPPINYLVNVVRNILFQGRTYYLSMMLIVGYDIYENKPKIYGIDLLGSLFNEENYLSFGSGSVFALGVLESGYKTSMSVKDGINLAKRAISAARNRDIASGSKIQLVVIDKTGYRQVEGA
ncbi:MAG: proteasome subunit beta [Promethearchaeota archaeon]